MSLSTRIKLIGTSCPNARAGTPADKRAGFLHRPAWRTLAGVASAALACTFALSSVPQALASTGSHAQDRDHVAAIMPAGIHRTTSTTSHQESAPKAASGITRAAA